MLVLSRRSQESIVIGGDIRVTIIKTSAGVVRLGIEAPTDVAVHREEVQQKIDADEQVDSRRQHWSRGTSQRFPSSRLGWQG